MAAHLSQLRLDLLATGAGSSAERAHVEGCDRCRERLAQITSARQAFEASERFEPALRNIEIVHQSRPRRAPWRLALLGAVPAVALAALLVVLRPADAPEVRYKAAVEISLQRVDGTDTEIRPGDRVALRSGAAGHSQLLVLAVEESGDVVQLWPVGAESSGAVPAGARAPLQPAFKVTPGSFTLHAFYADAPFEAQPLRATLSSAVAEARREQRSLSEVVPASLPENTAHVRRHIVVPSAH